MAEAKLEADGKHQMNSGQHAPTFLNIANTEQQPRGQPGLLTRYSERHRNRKAVKDTTGVLEGDVVTNDVA